MLFTLLIWLLMAVKLAVAADRRELALFKSPRIALHRAPSPAVVTWVLAVTVVVVLS